MPDFGKSPWWRRCLWAIFVGPRTFGRGYVMGMICAGGMIVSGLNLVHLHELASYRGPTPLTLAERSADSLTQVVPPLTVLLRFVDRATFAKERGDADVVAFSRPFTRPCQIVMQAGKVIVAVPSHGYATWLDDDDSETVAHEILHCIRGDWHPDWSVIKSTAAHEAARQGGN